MKSVRLALPVLVIVLLGFFSDGAAWGQTHLAPRVGVPSFWQAMDVTMMTWAIYVQSHFPLWGTIVSAVVLSYFSGLIAFNIAFALGNFGPRAAAFGMWILTLILFCFCLMLLPLTWPWWSPFVVFFVLLLLTAILLGTMSKKSMA